MYILTCSDEQIGELMQCYGTFTEINIRRNQQYDYVNVEMTVDGLPESYTLYDYDVTVYDWDDTDTDCLAKYRKKMLDFFGNQYAIDYLLMHNNL